MRKLVEQKHREADQRTIAALRKQNRKARDENARLRRLLATALKLADVKDGGPGICAVCFGQMDNDPAIAGAWTDGKQVVCGECADSIRGGRERCRVCGVNIEEHIAGKLKAGPGASRVTHAWFGCGFVLCGDCHTEVQRQGVTTVRLPIHNLTENTRQDSVPERRFVMTAQNEDGRVHLAICDTGRGQFWVRTLDATNETYGQDARRFLTRAIRKACADKLREWRKRR